MQRHGGFSPKSIRQSSNRTPIHQPNKTLVRSSEEVPKIRISSPSDVKQWEEAKCCICLEHPHNAVLLRCSSYDKGCRPYVCNTSYRHSNCLDKYCKSSTSSPSTLTMQGNPSASMDSRTTWQTNISVGESEEKLSCPLCRGEIHGWFVVEAARKFMDSKSRSCSYESCDFNGNYSELRKHARSEHPAARPSEVDPERQRDWTRQERLRDFSDVFSFMSSSNEEEEEMEGMSSLTVDGFESLYASVASSIHIIELSLYYFYMSRMEDDIQNEGTNLDRHNNNFRRYNGSGRNHWQQNIRGRRHNISNNNLNPRQNNSFRGNVTERMYQRRMDSVRSRRDQQRNNFRSTSDQHGNNGRRNRWEQSE